MLNFFKKQINEVAPRMEPGYEMQVKGSQHVKATLTVRMECPKVEAKEWIFYIAHPPATPSMEVHSVRLCPEGNAAEEMSDGHRPMLLARALVKQGDSKTTKEFKAEYDVTLQKRKLVELKKGEGSRRAAVPEISAEVRKQALASTALYDLETASFLEWVAAQKLQRQAKEAAVDYARRVFAFIQSHFEYEYVATMDRRASVVCSRGRGDCGGLNGLFAATLRANSIPARVLVGRWAQSQKLNETLFSIPYVQQHVKSEFYADGIGWVPVNVTVSKTPDLTCFGEDKGDFITMHFDSHLIINTLYWGPQTVDFLQGGVSWVSGSGTLDGAKKTEEWEVVII